MRDCLNEILNESCLLTLTQLNRELRLRLPRKPRTCDCTMARTLEGMLLRIKLTRPVPAYRNRPDVIYKRLDYANWFMGRAVMNHTVFIDECGYKIWTSRSWGRARGGNWSTDRSVVSEEEMLLSQWPFHRPMVWFSTLGMNLMHVNLMTSWYEQD